MNLHLQKETFLEAITIASDLTGHERCQIEKDYYVSYILKALLEKSPDFIFKGGTSLSKCYKAIDRFSEDIDLYYPIDSSLSKTRQKNYRKALSLTIQETIQGCQFQLTNQDEIQSDKYFNKYDVDFNPIENNISQMKERIVIETSLFTEASPVEKKLVSNYIYEALQGNPNFIKKFNLEPFESNVQAMERTFIDKLFAICDYHERGTYSTHSRHLYDIHMLWNHQDLDIEKVANLFNEVTEIRRSAEGNAAAKLAPSCMNGYELKGTMKVIIDSNVYMDDYNHNTLHFLNPLKQVDYNTSIRSLFEILEESWLPDKISI